MTSGRKLVSRFAVSALSILVGAGLTLAIGARSATASWARHTIDLASRGADGARLADVNGDGWLDVTTGWEEGGEVRVCLHPGAARCKLPWPAVTVGQVKSPEDALFVDLDSDQSFDVVSCCEGKTRSVFVHWAPARPTDLLLPKKWTTVPIPATRGREMWMFAAAANIDNQGSLDLFVGSKGTGGSVSWLEVPSDARNVAKWQLHRLRDAGWIMSLVPRDMDGDGDTDLVVSDRKGRHRGVFWLEHPGFTGALDDLRWKEHAIGGEDHEVMFLDVCDLDVDRQADILVATRNSRILWFRRAPGTRERWNMKAIPNPYGVPHGKAVQVGDIDLDGRLDIVHSANTYGDRLKPGVAWLKCEGTPLSGPWKQVDISRDEGVKFDLVPLYDVDGDGDLDVITTEERDNFGVVWYENPCR